MESWVIVVIVAVGLPMLVGMVAIVLEHWEKMAAMKARRKADGADQNRLSHEYQEFVLGVDARLQKIEERLRLIESRQRQSGDSGESQRIRRG